MKGRCIIEVVQQNHGIMSVRGFEAHPLENWQKKKGWPVKLPGRRTLQHEGGIMSVRGFEAYPLENWQKKKGRPVKLPGRRTLQHEGGWQARRSGGVDGNVKKINNEYCEDYSNLTKLTGC
ncbi:hypothetical protein AVEN_191230-1 [Araneus ventricosus]|uniref:Uncharacterized protein n=1 Tax=Araneus ventricosus TaxID=182803 RepID=A0A4Y2PFU3_ARAVE|nr:hypothetical protein AVEN_191230-1 [Araneus ventricosus]